MGASQSSVEISQTEYVKSLIASAEEHDWDAFLLIFLSNRKFHQTCHRYRNNLTAAVVMCMLGDDAEDDDRARPPPPFIVDKFLSSCVVNDFDIMNFLSDACQLSASLSIVSEYMKRVNPNLVETKSQLTSERNVLHHAASAERPNVELVSAIMEAFPDCLSEADDCGLLPLHEICRNENATPELLALLLNAYPEASGAIDNAGETPLHYAWNMFGDSVETVHLVATDRDKQAASEDASAIDAVSWAVHERLRLLLGAMSTAAGGEPPHPIPLYGMFGTEKREPWYPLDAALTVVPRVPEGLLDFLLAVHLATHQRGDDMGRLPLHMVAKVASVGREHGHEVGFRDDGGSVLEWHLGLNPGAARLADRSGTLPLHTASGKYSLTFRDTAALAGVAVDTRQRIDDDSESESEEEQEEEDSDNEEEDEDDEETEGNDQKGGMGNGSNSDRDFRMIFDAYPEGCRAKDNDGRLPLHYAILSGRAAPATALVDAYPDSLVVTDPETGLCPGLLALTTNSFTVDMVYGLIRSDPSCVDASRIPRRARDNLLKRRLCSLEVENQMLWARVRKLQRLS